MTAVLFYTIQHLSTVLFVAGDCAWWLTVNKECLQESLRSNVLTTSPRKKAHNTHTCCKGPVFLCAELYVKCKSPVCTQMAYSVTQNHSGYSQWCTVTSGIPDTIPTF